MPSASAQHALVLAILTLTALSSASRHSMAQQGDPPPTLQLQQASAAAKAHDALEKCDHIAALLTASGRRQESPEPTPSDAITACKIAVQLNPEVARSHYQLGLGYWLALRDQAAVAEFFEAAKHCHAKAMRAIGDAYVEGRGLPDGQGRDLQKAIEWYGKADVAGPNCQPAESTASLHSLLPMLIAAAALLAMISQRNADIATRFRNNTQEYIKIEKADAAADAVSVQPTEPQLSRPADPRLHLLVLQNRWFFLRYTLTSACFVLLSIAIIALALAATANVHGLKALQLGRTLLAYSLLVVVPEFATGWLTLLFDGRDQLMPKSGKVRYKFWLLTLLILSGFIMLITFLVYLSCGSVLYELLEGQRGHHR